MRTTTSLEARFVGRDNGAAAIHLEGMLQ